jgi:cytochrome P450
MNEFDPEDPAFAADPHHRYRELRDLPRAAWSPRLDGWVVTRYDDVHAVLHDHRRFSSDERHARVPRMRRAANPGGRNVVSSDPPAHTRLRRILNRHFTPASIRAWEPRVRALVAETLDASTTPRSFDAIRDLAIPLPLSVIAEMLGVPASDRSRFATWSENEITQITPDTPAADVDRLEQSSSELHAYFLAAIERARRRGAGCERGLLGVLVAAADDEDRLTNDELLAFATLLLRSGQATTTHLIGNALHALATAPAAWAALLSGRTSLPLAVEELLRYAGPVQSIHRIVREPVVVHGISLLPGDRVHVVLASANRDERRFEDPDAMRIDRMPNDHVAFGSGIHWCLGAELARLELRLVLEGLLERAPSLEIAIPPNCLEHAWTWTIRGLASLPLTIAAREES